MKYVLSAALFLLLCACVPARPPQVSAHTDTFNPNVDLDGPAQSSTSWTASWHWQLRSLVNKQTHEATHALYFETDYHGVKDPLMLATDDHGQTLILLRLHPDKGPCNPAVSGECEYVEKTEVLLNAPYLKAHATSGFVIKISSRDGIAYSLPVTPQMIELQLNAAVKY